MSWVVLSVSMAVWLLVSFTGCRSAADSPPNGHEISAASSPDGLSRAFVWAPELSNALGATISQSYQVWLQSQRGANPEALIFDGDKTDGVRLMWRNASAL